MEIAIFEPFGANFSGFVFDDGCADCALEFFSFYEDNRK